MPSSSLAGRDSTGCTPASSASLAASLAASTSGWSKGLMPMAAPVSAVAISRPRVRGREIATALTGAAMGINPFDQPDVEAAKDAAREALDAGVQPVESRPANELLGILAAGDYLAIQVYVDPADPV